MKYNKRLLKYIYRKYLKPFIDREDLLFEKDVISFVDTNRQFLEEEFGASLYIAE